VSLTRLNAWYKYLRMSQRWNKTSAAAAALKSAAVRRARAEAKLSFEPSVKLDPSPAQSAASPSTTPSVSTEVSGYVKLRLSRVRSQLSKLDATLTEELAKPDPDARRVESLSRAAASLQTQEQNLSGRPLPGAYRPEPVRTQRSLVEYSTAATRRVMPSIVTLPAGDEPVPDPASAQ
jgi:hypothetical protein